MPISTFMIDVAKTHNFSRPEYGNLCVPKWYPKSCFGILSTIGLQHLATTGKGGQAPNALGDCGVPYPWPCSECRCPVVDLVDKRIRKFLGWLGPPCGIDLFFCAWCVPGMSTTPGTASMKLWCRMLWAWSGVTGQLPQFRWTHNNHPVPCLHRGGGEHFPSLADTEQGAMSAWAITLHWYIHRRFPAETSLRLHDTMCIDAEQDPLAFSDPEDVRSQVEWTWQCMAVADCPWASWAPCEFDSVHVVIKDEAFPRARLAALVEASASQTKPKKITSSEAYSDNAALCHNMISNIIQIHW